MAALIRLQSLRGALLRAQVPSFSYAIRPRSASSLFLAPRSNSVALFSSKTKQKFTPRADPNAAKFEQQYLKPKQQAATPPPPPPPPAAPAAQPTPVETPARVAPEQPVQQPIQPAAPATPVEPEVKPPTFTSVYEEQMKVKVTPPPSEPAPVKAQSKTGGSGGSGFPAPPSEPLDPAAEAKRRIRNSLVLALVSVFVAIFYKVVRNVAMTQDVDEDEEIPSESILQSVAPTDEARQMVRFARYHTVRIVVPKENKDVEPQLNVNNVAAHMFREMPAHARFTTFLGCDKSVASLPGFGEFPVGTKLGPLTVIDRTPTAILFSRKEPSVGDISIVVDVKKALVTEHSSIFLACIGTVIQNPQPLASTILSGSARLDASLTRLYLKRGTMALRGELGILKDPFYKSPASTVSNAGSGAAPASPAETALVHPVSKEHHTGITAAK